MVGWFSHAGEMDMPRACKRGKGATGTISNVTWLITRCQGGGKNRANRFKADQ